VQPGSWMSIPWTSAQRNGTIALIYGFATGRIQHKWFPVSIGAFWRDFTDALTFRLSHDDLSVYNAVQRVT
jgi:thiosulfate reductase cytochrome b subunit